MKDSGGVVFNVELFHVSVPGLRTGTEHEHLLGITQNSQNLGDQMKLKVGITDCTYCYNNSFLDF